MVCTNMCICVRVLWVLISELLLGDWFGLGMILIVGHSVISSKTKNSKKVCTLYLQRDALLSSSGSDKTWQANVGLRNPSKDEMKLSPNGSFTKVEISELKMKSLDVDLLRCKLKDIYFPYIQCDDLSTSGRTLTPIEFQVNGIDLAEVEGGEEHFVILSTIF